MSISTAICKAEITKIVINNPSIVTDQFDAGESADPAKLTKNWKRIEKGKMDNGNTERIFDCTPYNDQLRAYVIDDGEKILEISIVGE